MKYEKGCFYNDLSITQLEEKLVKCGLSKNEFIIRKQEDGMKLNEPYSIGLTGIETIIEINKKKDIS